MNIEVLDELYKKLENCNLCPHNCGVNRYYGSNGICGMGIKLRIASYGPHFGEEPEIVGFNGSGTIFFSSCTLSCVFCQNFNISSLKEGYFKDEAFLADVMLNLQESGCTNINLVTPTHFTPQIIKALILAKNYGLNIPIVYNSNGYDKVETLKYWDGLVDIYMPDLKMISKEKSSLYLSVDDYFELASSAVVEMHRQVGDLIIKDNIAEKGLLIRHLVLPNGESDTKEVIDFIAERIGANTYLNLMDQYSPCYKSHYFSLIRTRVPISQYNAYIDYAKEKGFSRPDYLFGS